MARKIRIGCVAVVMLVALLRLAPDGTGLRRDIVARCNDRSLHRSFLAGQPPGGIDARALLCLGQFRRRAELRAMASEPLRAGYRNRVNPSFRHL